MRQLALYLGRGLLLSGFPLMFAFSLPAGVAALAAGAVLVGLADAAAARAPTN